MILYQKKGRRYHKLREFSGFPAEGVWLVQRKPGITEQRLLTRIGEVPDLVPLLRLEAHRDDVLKAVGEVTKGMYSHNDLVDAIFKVLAGKEFERTENNTSPNVKFGW